MEHEQVKCHECGALWTRTRVGQRCPCHDAPLVAPAFDFNAVTMPAPSFEPPPAPSFEPPPAPAPSPSFDSGGGGDFGGGGGSGDY